MKPARFKSEKDFKNAAPDQRFDSEAIARVAKRYAVGVTSHVMDMIAGDVQNDPIAKQYIPQLDELKILPEENPDPIGDHVHTPVKGIVHRYPDRVLFKPANICAVYCRYCFRREMVGPGSDVLTQDEIEAALDYIRTHKNVWEVILTGGDPLVLSARQLKNILRALNEIEHVQVVRLHSRVPIADPKRITPDVLDTLRTSSKALYVVVHINHARELAQDVKTTLKNLHDAGCVLLSQSVLLKGVNDNAKTLEDLFRALIANRVKPYYLHQGDLAPGTSHFRTSIEDGQAIMKDLHGNLSGICLPQYMLDIPGGYGKIPIGPNYMKPIDNETYELEDYQGCKHSYPPKQGNQS